MATALKLVSPVTIAGMARGCARCGAWVQQLQWSEQHKHPATESSRIRDRRQTSRSIKHQIAGAQQCKQRRNVNAPRQVRLRSLRCHDGFTVENWTQHVFFLPMECSKEQHRRLVRRRPGEFPFPVAAGNHPSRQLSQQAVACRSPSKRLSRPLDRLNQQLLLERQFPGSKASLGQEIVLWVSVHHHPHWKSQPATPAGHLLARPKNRHQPSFGSRTCRFVGRFLHPTA